jgi:hypothetical protein
VPAHIDDRPVQFRGAVAQADAILEGARRLAYRRCANEIAAFVAPIESSCALVAALPVIWRGLVHLDPRPRIRIGIAKVRAPDDEAIH